jgi:hypothetical protein
MKTSLLLSALACGLAAMSAPQLALADNDQCRNVSFSFTNNHTSGRDIKVVQVKYHNVVNDRNPTVDVVDTVCAPGQTCRTPGIDLRDVEGNNIKDVTFIYREKDRQGNWMEPWSRGAGPFDPSNKQCRANRNYGPFAITGTLSPTSSQLNPNAVSSATKAP